MRTIILLFFLSISCSLSAQQLDQAVGLRGGFSSGITYQHFHSQSEDVKLLLSFREGGAQLTGLFEVYTPVMLGYYDQFFVYYGLGVHAGFTRYESRWWNRDNRWERGYPSTRPVIGADAIVGIEYRIEQIPLTIGFDYKPFFEFFGQDFFRLSMGDFAFAIKYNF
jgi:hypothetical protein